MAAPSGFAPVDGTCLYYEITGSGPVVMLLHCHGADHRIWADQVAALSPHCTTLAFDLRGFGKSPPGENRYAHADDVRHALDHLGIDRVVPVGLSLGGGAGINFAVLYPERTRGLVAADSSLGGYRWSRRFSGMLALSQIAARMLGAGAANRGFVGAPNMAGLRRRPAAYARMREIMADYSGWHWAHADRGRPLTPPAIERLDTIRVPTLAIVGELDSRDFHGVADTLVRLVPGARKVVIPNAGHMTNMEEPAAFNRALLEFLDALPA